jgi:hypothetical protein
VQKKGGGIYCSEINPVYLSMLLILHIASYVSHGFNQRGRDNGYPTLDGKNAVSRKA